MNQVIAAHMWGASPQRREGSRRISSPGEGAAGPRVAMQSPGGSFRHPDELLLNDRLDQAAMEIGEQFKDTKASKQQTNVMTEFFQFCKCQCGKEDLFPYNLNQEKVTRFMMYQSQREAKPKGGTEESRARAKAGIHFNEKEHQGVIDGIKDAPICPLTGKKIYPKATRPTAHQSFAAYKAIIRRIYKIQVSRKVQPLPWDHIWTVNLDELYKSVKERKPIVAKLNYEEKVQDEFASYTVVERYEEIEQSLWDDSHTVGLRSVCMGLRHRHCLLHMTTGILRAESLHRAELSDFRSFKVGKLSTDVHDLFMMVNQIPHGKTTHGNVQCGRATRHKESILCCIGALAFYLTLRIYVTGEFKNMTTEDWKDNRKWFDIKLLADANNKDTKKEMRNDTYAKKIKETLTRLGIICSKLLHLGRNLGAKILDLLQEEESSIDAMGQWAQNMRQKHYSSKLPMAPIRKLAGYEDSKHYYNPRTQVIPSEELKRMTPIGKWCYDSFNDPLAVAQPGKFRTALTALKFFCDLNEVFLQDAAALMVEHPERAGHPIFKELPLFQSTEFEQHKERMQHELHRSEMPFNATIETVLPGVQQMHRASHEAIRTVNTKADSLTKKVDQIGTEVSNLSSQLRGGILSEASQKALKMDLAKSLVSVARELLQQPTTAQTTSPSTSSTATTVATTPAGSPPTFESSFMTPLSPTTTIGTSPSAFPSVPTVPMQNPAGASKFSPQEIALHSSFRYVLSHNNLTDLYNEWYGKGSYEDNYGGISGRDKKYGTLWRKHLKKHDMLRSRTGNTVKAVEQFAKEQNVTALEACALLQSAFESAKCSVATFVKNCQANGLLKKQGARGKAAAKKKQQQQQQIQQQAV